MSDSSELSSAPSDVEEPAPPPPEKQKTLKLNAGKLTFAVAQDAPKQPSPEPSPPRAPSPPHEYVLADNPDIAFLVMFRHRFADAFPKNVPNLGPQDIEHGIVDTIPSLAVDNLLCALLGLVLNRKKDVERGHYTRALEDALSSQRHQWPPAWSGVNPMPGQKSFSDLNPDGKLSLLKALALWSLNTSDVIREIIASAYKQARKDDDLNQPLSVQPWGLDGQKKRYWLIEGQTDTSFRIYKQGSLKAKKEKWWSVAGSIEELKGTAESLRSADGSQAARRLADRMEVAVPRLEASEEASLDEKRKRKEYRQTRKAAFTRPEPGFSMYEGRTRGKRMRYTFSDDEDDDPSDSGSARRSNRQSERSTPVDAGGSTMTSSGRQVRSKYGRSYGDPIHEVRRQSPHSLQDDAGSGRRTRGQANFVGRSSRIRNEIDGATDEDDDGEVSGEEWHGDDEDFEGKLDAEEDDETSDGISEDNLVHEPRSLVIALKYGKRPPVNGHISLSDGFSKQTQELDNDCAPAILASAVKQITPAPTPGRPTSSKSSSKNHSPGMVLDQRSSASSPRPLSSSSQQKPLTVFKPDPYGAFSEPHSSNIDRHPESYMPTQAQQAQQAQQSVLSSRPAAPELLNGQIGPQGPLPFVHTTAQPLQPQYTAQQAPHGHSNSYRPYTYPTESPPTQWNHTQQAAGAHYSPYPQAHSPRFQPPPAANQTG